MRNNFSNSKSIIHRRISSRGKKNTNLIFSEKLIKNINLNKINIVRSFTSNEILFKSSELPFIFFLLIGFFDCVLVLFSTEYLIENYFQWKEKY